MSDGRAYLDTNVLIGSIIGNHEEKCMYSSLIEDLSKNHSLDVYIPQIVLGESLSIIIKKSEDDKINKNIQNFSEKLHKLTDMRKECFPIIKPDIMEKAREIYKDDPNSEMDQNDFLILAHAICDNMACYLYTSDGQIHKSEKARCLINERDSTWKKLKLADPGVTAKKGRKRGF